MGIRRVAVASSANCSALFSLFFFFWSHARRVNANIFFNPAPSKQTQLAPAQLGARPHQGLSIKRHHSPLLPDSAFL